MLIETYGVAAGEGDTNSSLHVPAPGAVYAHDRFVYWQFTAHALTNLAAFTERPNFELHATLLIDGHPRIIGAVS